MCIFCSIVKGDIPSAKIYEDDLIYAFKDINPQAPVHTIVIPKAHIESADEVNGENSSLVAHIFEKAGEIARISGADNGYRVITNCGPDACQSVKHLHFHILGGKQLAEKMD